MVNSENPDLDNADTDSYRLDPMSLDEPEDNATRGVYAIKRGVDILGASVGLILSSPLIAYSVISMATEKGVDRKSRRQLFYSQKRIGMGGEPFDIYKIRTMPIGESEWDNETEYDIKERLLNEDINPRTTKRGQRLRKLGWDELPQLFNVIKGDMSLVGSRPLNIKDCEELYERGYTPHSHKTKPGITGYPQLEKYKIREIRDMDDVHSYMSEINTDIDDADLNAYISDNFQTLNDAKFYLTMELYDRYPKKFGESLWGQTREDLGQIMKTPFILARGKHL